MKHTRKPENKLILRELSSVKKFILIVIGTLSLGLGILGIFLPLLPTTPFLLLTAACYAKSSEKLYNRLLNNKCLGKYIIEYQKKRGIRRTIKIYVLSLLWTSILTSIVFCTENLWLRILLGCVAVCVTIHISTFKTL